METKGGNHGREQQGGSELGSHGCDHGSTASISEAGRRTRRHPKRPARWPVVAAATKTVGGAGTAAMAAAKLRCSSWPATQPASGAVWRLPERMKTSLSPFSPSPSLSLSNNCWIFLAAASPSPTIVGSLSPPPSPRLLQQSLASSRRRCRCRVVFFNNCRLSLATSTSVATIVFLSPHAVASPSPATATTTSPSSQTAVFLSPSPATAVAASPSPATTAYRQPPPALEKPDLKWI
ncbi:uncharacterized protein LOC127791963 [Diospyros lotus]|uniref:uncharacterized protein LOC127791963 n=1 Tax=Diospyros lotus TaxID=55363 RepID=UPI0022527683|nr:uncharacterized protein LOC127791963 [Diospyros lotus]